MQYFNIKKKTDKRAAGDKIEKIENDSARTIRENPKRKIKNRNRIKLQAKGNLQKTKITQFFKYTTTSGGQGDENVGEISISIIKDNLEPNGPSNEPSKTDSRTSDDDGTKERGTLTSRKKVIKLEAKSESPTVDKSDTAETPKCPVGESDQKCNASE